MITVIKILFWSITALILYSYFGYFLIMYFLSKISPKKVDKKAVEPYVTFLITAYNEEKNIKEKLENVLILDYPQAKLDVIVASDGSSDRTDDIVRTFIDTVHNIKIKLVRLEGRKGKTAAQNEAVKCASGEIIVFSDATTRYDTGALKNIVRNFNDPGVGCVSGRLCYRVDTKGGIAGGERSYWEYEISIKEYQSRVWSLTGATGCIYALRRKLYRQLPADIISDLVEPLKIVEQGYRVVLEKDAIAYEKACEKTSDEMSMRIRVVTRGMRGLLYIRRLFNPTSHPYYFFQIFSHKVLRWFFVELAVVLILCNLVLLNEPLYIYLFLLQCAFYGSALLGYLVNKSGTKKVKFIGIPLYFMLVHLASVYSLIDMMRGKKNTIWETNR